MISCYGINVFEIFLTVMTNDYPMTRKSHSLSFHSFLVKILLYLEYIKIWLFSDSEKNLLLISESSIIKHIKCSYSHCQVNAFACIFAAKSSAQNKIFRNSYSEGLKYKYLMFILLPKYWLLSTQYPFSCHMLFKSVLYLRTKLKL